MGLYNIIDFLKSFGIIMTINDNKFKFYDEQSNEEMKCFVSNTYHIDKDACVDNDVTLDKVLKNATVWVLSNNKNFSF